MFKLLKKKHFLSFALVLFVLIFLGAFYGSAYRSRIHKTELYNLALEQIENNNYEEAIDILAPLGMFQDATRYIAYSEAMLLMEKENYSAAYDQFIQLEDFYESELRADEANNAMAQLVELGPLYEAALKNYNDGNLLEALSTFQQLGDYRDSQHYVEACGIKLQRLTFSHTITAGIQFSAGITQDGTVVFSGKNFDGESDIYSWSDIISISSNNEFFMGLKEDGTVLTAKRDSNYKYRVDTSDWTNIVDISTGEQYVVGLRADGTLTAQGIDGYGETNIDDWRDIIAIDTGWQHTVGLDKNGGVHITGFNSESLLTQIHEQSDQWKDIISISTGGSTGSGNKGRGHVVALKRDGTVVAVGDNSFGQCNVSEWKDIIAISAGDYHTVGLCKDGSIVTTQTREAYPESYNEVSSWENIVAVAAGYGFTLGLQSDGTVKAAGLNREGQINVDDWSNVIYRDEWSLVFRNNDSH